MAAKPWWVPRGAKARLFSTFRCSHRKAAFFDPGWATFFEVVPSHQGMLCSKTIQEIADLKMDSLSRGPPAECPPSGCQWCTWPRSDPIACRLQEAAGSFSMSCRGKIGLYRAPTSTASKCHLSGAINTANFPWERVLCFFLKGLWQRKSKDPRTNKIHDQILAILGQFTSTADKSLVTQHDPCRIELNRIELCGWMKTEAFVELQCKHLPFACFSNLLLLNQPRTFNLHQQRILVRVAWISPESVARPPHVLVGRIARWIHYEQPKWDGDHVRRYLRSWAV